MDTIPNPTPEINDRFGRWGAFLENGGLLLSSNKDDAGALTPARYTCINPSATQALTALAHYSFTGLESGTYEVREIVQPGYMQTAPGGDGTYSVTLAAGQDVTGLDFGNQWQPVLLFSDSFENGQWNGLWVEDSQNDWFTSTQRATDGSYSAEVDGRATDATLTMANPVDLTPYGSAELTFDW